MALQFHITQFLVDLGTFEICVFFTSFISDTYMFSVDGLAKKRIKIFAYSSLNIELKGIFVKCKHVALEISVE
jgi:hypothetical protein